MKRLLISPLSTKAAQILPLTDQLKVAIQSSQQASVLDPDLQDRCARAESMAVELQRELDMQKNVNTLLAFTVKLKGIPVEVVTTTSAPVAATKVPFSAPGGIEGGLMAQILPQLGAGLGQLDMPHTSSTCWMGCGAVALFATPRVAPPRSTPWASSAAGA